MRRWLQGNASTEGCIIPDGIQPLTFGPGRRELEVRLSRCVILLSLVVLVAGFVLPGHPGASVLAAVPGKKVCKKVKKHGKLTKVCHTVKPAPTATSAATSTPAPTATPTTVVTPSTPHPLAVTVQKDAGRAVTRTIGPAGGSITATG